MAVSGDDLYKTVLAGDTKTIQTLLGDLKTHVKKDNVNLSYVPKYFESLSIVMDSPDRAVQSVAFSLICHLVKRVSIQDHTGNILGDHSYLVLPIVIPKIADPKSSISAPARRALEAYWLSAPEKVEHSLVDVGLRHRSVLVINECVVWLNHILTLINPQFKLDAFFDVLAATLSKYASHEALVENIKILLANYYDLRQNSLRKFELHKVLEANGVSASLRNSIMGTDSVLSHPQQARANFSSSQNSNDHKIRDTGIKAREVKPTLKTPRESAPRSATEEDQPNHSADSPNGTSAELMQLTERLPSYKIDPTIPSQDVDSYEAIHKMILDMTPFFEGKETERNWARREKSIQQLRSLIRGNARHDYLHDLLLAIRAISEGIQKALLSLRTTLGVHSCQMIKEMAILLGNDFDTLAEVFLATLIKLSSATKHLANTNANIAVSAILINCTLHSRIIQKIASAATDKSASTKAYAAFWLEIYMVRTHSQPGSSDIVERLLPKLLGDPNSQVRQAAKDSYWRFRKYSPELGEGLLAKLDTNVVRALERSRPVSDRFASPLLPKKSRPSIKEVIAVKNKQLRAKPTEIRSNSSFLPRRPSEYEAERSRLTSSRITSDPLRSTPASQLGHSSEPHYAQSTFSHRTTVKLSHESPKASSAPPVESVSSVSTSGFSPPATESKHNSHDSRMDVVTSESLLNLSASFEGRNDPIIKFLSSSQEEFVREGVSLLRYAVIGDEEISTEIILATRKVSISHPEHLKPLFEENDGLLKKSSRLFQIEDFIRVCAILLPATEKNVDVILSLYDIEKVYDSIITLLSYVADLDNIVDERMLVMQIIKFKSKIINTLVSILINVTSKMPIGDVKFAQLTANLFDLVPIVHSSSGYSDFQLLLQNLHSINKVLFAAQLSLVVSSTKSEVEQTVGIDHTLQYVGDGTIYNMTDLTKISPGRPPVTLSPLKEPSDFTMLMPNPNLTISKAREEPKLAEFTQETEMDTNEDEFGSAQGVEDSPMKESGDTDVESGVATTEHSPEPEAEILQGRKSGSFDKHDGLNIFSTNEEAVKPTAFFTKLSSPDSSHELADDFAQVKLSAKSNSIQLFIDKVDPLNSISNKNRPITIFEDSKAGSPQKLREYSYTDFNWFNFLVARLTLDRETDEGEAHTIDEFKLLCKNLAACTISGTEFAALLEFLQNEQAPEFNQFYSKEGHLLIELSLWMFFLSSKAYDKLSGLIIAKQLLINRDSISLVHLWHTLLDLCSESATSAYELEVAISETFDEALCGVYSSAELFHVVSKSLKDAQMMEVRTLRFNVESLFKLMSVRTLALIINDDLICKADDVLHGLLDHRDTLVRKHVLQSYGKLVRAARVNDASGSNRSTLLEKTETRCIDELLVLVTGPQKKLIEFFSQ